MFTIEVMGKTIPVSEAIYRAYRRMMGTMPNENPGDIVLECLETSEVLMNLPGSFSETLKAHMDRLKVTRRELEIGAMLSEPTIKRMRNSDRDFELDHVIAICIALHLEPDYSFDLIEKAGYRLRNTPDHLIYKKILRTIYDLDLFLIQELLQVIGRRVLKLSAC